MKTSILKLLVAITAALLPVSAPHADDSIHFAAIDVIIDSAEPLASWQFELNDRMGAMKVVGVENGDSDAFSDAPYFDREAVNQGLADRIVVADFSLADESRLPSGHVRVSTVHVMIEGAGEPSFDLDLITATTFDGRPIDASISLNTKTGSTQ